MLFAVAVVVVVVVAVVVACRLLFAVCFGDGCSCFSICCVGGCCCLLFVLAMAVDVSQFSLCWWLLKSLFRIV